MADFDVQLDDNDAACVPDHEENLEDDGHEESNEFVAEREVDDASASVVAPGTFLLPVEEPSSVFLGGGEKDDGCDEIDCCVTGCDFAESSSSLVENVEHVEDEH